MFVVDKPALIFIVKIPNIKFLTSQPFFLHKSFPLFWVPPPIIHSVLTHFGFTLPRANDDLPEHESL